MNPILLDKQDILTLWEMNADRHAEEPFKEVRNFLGYYRAEHSDANIPDMFEYNYSNKRSPHTHPSVKLDVLEEFADFFNGKININENFLRLVNCLPKDTKISCTTNYFKYLNNKYPDFFEQVTAAMETRNTMRHHENNIIVAWVGLVHENKLSFKDQEVFEFMKDNFYEKDNTVIKKINILNRFDVDKVTPILTSILKQYDKNPAIIDAVSNYYEENGIAHTKAEIPLFEAVEHKLFHFNMKFQPEGVMQKLNVKEKDARNILIWACYYLAEHAYHGVQRERTTGEEQNASYDKPITLKIITPYEHVMKDAKPIYEEALQVLFNSDFLTPQRIKGLQENRFDENLAKEFKAFIKPAKLRQELSNTLTEKEDKAPRIKV